MKKIIIFLSLFLLLFSLVSIESHALSESEGKKLLKEINKSQNRSADYATLMSVYSALKSSGFSDYECAAILVNMNRESSIRPDAGQNGGGAIGLIQWDGGRRDALQKFSKAQGDTKYTIKGYKVGDIATQVAFLLAELTPNDKQKGNAKEAEYNWIDHKVVGLYKKVDEATAMKGITNKSVDLKKSITYEEWRKLDDCVAMSLYFTSCLERCAYGIDIYNEGAKQSKDMYKLLTGTDVSTVSTNEELSKDLAVTLTSCGLWGESELSQFCILTELNIDELYLKNAKRDTLTSNELNVLHNWEQNVDESSFGGKLIMLLRSAVMGAGIALVIYSILLYLAYWLDRLNTFFDFAFVKFLTLGKIETSPTELECTFKTAEVVKNNPQPLTVNHKAIIGVCMFSLIFAILLISGLIFTILGNLIIFIKGILS